MSSSPSIVSPAAAAAATSAPSSARTDVPLSSSSTIYSAQTTMFYRARNNLMRLLEHRGFNVENLVMESPELISELINNDDQILLSYYLDTLPEVESVRKCKVYFIKSLTIQSVLTTVKQSLEEDAFEPLVPNRDEVLILTFGVPSEATIKNSISFGKTHKLCVDVIALQHLCFYVLNHELVPEYEILRGEERENILKAMCLREEKQLPCIRKDDIISRYLGLRSGDIVRVRNKTPSFVSYSICSDA
jgi:DNA-directed RNA polymerase subunit H (RpoH/RPB5)